MTEAAGGDMDSFEELVHRYQHGAFNVAYGMVGDEHQAADLAQEAFLRVLENANTYKPLAKFSTYFFSILRRLCIDHYRKKKPDTRADFVSESEHIKTPPDKLIQSEYNEKVHSAIAALPHRQQNALILKHFQQMSYREIAEIIGCSVSAVDSLLMRARQTLRDKLTDLE